MTKITLAVTGSIAAYKAADLTSLLTKEGHDVTVLMTKSATQFITPLTLQVLSKNKVHLDIMDEERPELVNHIDLAKNTELFLVAPATADTISRLAQGRADDIITSVALALEPSVPKYFAPAMNTKMYQHPLTQKNIEILKKIDYNMIQPKKSLLACGDFGEGALADLPDILSDLKILYKINEVFMKKSKASDVAILSIFIAIMVVVQLLSQIIYSVWPLPIVPTLLHIPVIIGSIVLGVRKGAFLGLVMGLISVINSTIVTLPSSFMFSPLQPVPGTNHGSIWALVIAIVPRVLVGILPALVYRLAQNRFGAGLAAFVGTATNTLLVLSFIFLFFHDVTKQTFGALLASIITGNSIAEVIIAVILTMAIVPALSKARGNS